MILHERTIKIIITEKITKLCKEYNDLFGEQEFIFENPIGGYSMISLRNGFPFLKDINGPRLTYIRAIKGDAQIEVYKTLRRGGIYINKKEGILTYKVRPRQRLLEK